MFARCAWRSDAASEQLIAPVASRHPGGVSSPVKSPPSLDEDRVVDSHITFQLSIAGRRRRSGLVGDMVLGGGVQVFPPHAVVLQNGHGADEVAAGVEHHQHRALFGPGDARAHLVPTAERAEPLHPGVVGRPEGDAAAAHASAREGPPSWLKIEGSAAIACPAV